uniref:A/G-specific adenine DNA glycosylase n=1 Tax=Arundo donax TaxID=35708 RepID=A0A0A8YUI4_ARUDO
MSAGEEAAASPSAGAARRACRFLVGR